MSKSKPKDKKNENQNIYEKELEDKRREILDATFTIRKLQERLDRLTIENKELNERFDAMRGASLEEIEKLKIIVDTKQDENRTLLIKTSTIEIDKKNRDLRIAELERSLNEQLDQKNKEMENERIANTNKIKELENKLKEYEVFVSGKEQLERERVELRELLEFEKAEKIRELADKERERVQATDKLKNDMLHKIQETKTNLLSLKKQQLSTTTRLTVLQNHQLTSELEYQSKQTEKLLFKNQELQNKVTNLQRDLEIHKQVEQQLAKRSHFSRGIIKKLSQRVKQLEEIAEQPKQSQSRPSEPRQSFKDDKKRSEIVSALESNIDDLQRKYSKLQNQYDVLKNQNNYLQTKSEEHESKVEKIGLLLVRYIDDILEGNCDVKDDNYVYDLKNLKKTDVKNWHRDEVALTVNLLLNMIKPLLTKSNINKVIPTLKKNLVLVDEQENDTVATVLPKITGQTSSSQGERRTQIKSRLHDMPVNIATKIVGSSLREWGKTVGNSTSSINLSRKYKVGESLK